MSIARRLIVAAAAIVAVLPSASAAAQGQGDPFYVAVTWNQQRAHFLDSNFNELSSFAVTDFAPNGVAASSSLIYTGHFSGASIVAYDHSGVEQFRFSDASRMNYLQSLAYTGSELAVTNEGMTHFFDALTGAYTRSFANSGSTIEALAMHNGLLWELGDELIARDLLTGAQVTSIANAAGNCSFGGTGLESAGAGVLAITCTDGTWMRVSDVDGSLLSSGNNGLEMYGLARITAATVVPEPASIVLTAFGLVAVGGMAARRRRHSA